MGFKECQDELMRYFVEEEGWDSKDKLLARIMGHLDQSSVKFNSESGCMDENGKTIYIKQLPNQFGVNA